MARPRRIRVCKQLLGPVLLGLALTACATADPINFSNGQPGYQVGCTWGVNGVAQCYRKAGDLCADRGYTLRDWQGRQISFAAVEDNLSNNFSTLPDKPS